MSWGTQGRQGHGWFGHGTAPPNTPADRPAIPASLDHRTDIVVGSLLGHFHSPERRHAALQPEGPAARDLAAALRVWIAAARLGGRVLDAALPPATSDAVARHLREAALLTAAARDPDGLNQAGAALASATRIIGLDRLRPFASAAIAAAELAVAASPVLRGAIAGTEAGAALGVETGAGLVVTAAVGGLIGAGLGYLAGGATKPAPALPRSDGGTVFQRPTHSVPGGAAGTSQPPSAAPERSLAPPAAKAWPVVTPGARIDGPQIGIVLEAKQASPEEVEKRRRIIAGKGLPTGGDMPITRPNHGRRPSRSLAGRATAIWAQEVRSGREPRA